MVEFMATVRALRPLPGERASWQPRLSPIRDSGLTAIEGRRGVASENVARELARRDALATAVWLRIEPLDADPRCLAESLHIAIRHAGVGQGASLASPSASTAAAPRSMRDVGHRLAEVIDDSRVVVVEDAQSTRATAKVIEALVGYLDHSGPDATAVHLNHRSLPPRTARYADLVINESRGRSPDVSDVAGDGDGAVSVSALARLMWLAAREPALMNDVLDAAALRDPDLITALGNLLPRRRLVRRRMTRRLLPLLAPVEVQALMVAIRTSYWHPSFADRPSRAPVSLRPWMLPLEDDWWWLRPAWLGPLTQCLNPLRRSGRRFFSTYGDVELSSGRDGAGVTDVIGYRGPTQPALLAPTSVTTFSSDSRRGGGIAAAPTTPADPESDEPTADSPEPTRVVRARMLGVFDVSIDEVPVRNWHGRLGRSILAYLLLQHEHRASREELIEVFWRDAEVLPAQNRLRVAISSLRRSLRELVDDAMIEYRDGTYRLARNCRVHLDVDDFEENARAARQAQARDQAHEALSSCQRALECYRADFLIEMPYEEWTILPREAHRVTYLECLTIAASLHMAREEHSEVLRLAWAILATDAAREDAHRLIMRCHVAKGQISQALRQFELCRHELSTILEVEPSTETKELADSIARSSQRSH